MALPSYRSYLTVIHAIAFACTGFRLFHRYRMRRLWWDDFWAASTLIFDIMCFATIWIPTDLAARGSSAERKRTIVFHLMAIMMIFTIWSARVSVAFSVIRILPPGTTMRRFTTGVIVVFGLACIGLFLHKFWKCGKLWHPGQPCTIVPSVGIVQLSADVLADILLIGIPISMLWRMRLPDDQRILILCIFATSFTMTCISIAHNIYIFRVNTFKMRVTAYLEAAIGLIVCNLLVVVTCIYRFLRNGEELEATTADYVSSRPRLTTIVTGAPMTTISFTDVSGMHTFDADTNQSSGHDTTTAGANSVAGNKLIGTRISCQS